MTTMVPARAATAAAHEAALGQYGGEFALQFHKAQFVHRTIPFCFFFGPTWRAETSGNTSWQAPTRVAYLALALIVHRGAELEIAVGVLVGANLGHQSAVPLQRARAVHAGHHSGLRVVDRLARAVGVGDAAVVGRGAVPAAVGIMPLGPAAATGTHQLTGRQESGKLTLQLDQAQLVHEANPFCATGPRKRPATCLNASGQRTPFREGNRVTVGGR